MTDTAENNRVYWHSRRGMLEIDLVLMPFARDVYPQLPPEEQALYVKLLAEEDQDIFAWLLRHREPAEPGLARIVGIILERHGQARPAPH